MIPAALDFRHGGLSRYIIPSGVARIRRTASFSLRSSTSKHKPESRHPVGVGGVWGLSMELAAKEREKSNGTPDTAAPLGLYLSHLSDTSFRPAARITIDEL